MPTKQGDLALIRDRVAQDLLHSTALARLAYVWDDGTPRVVPLWFHWNESEGALVFGTPVTSPKTHILPNHSAVAITIDSETWPYKVLQIRGTAKVTVVDGVAPEYAEAAKRYFGPEQGKAWVGNIKQMFTQMARVAVSPAWVGILDFEQRFPSAIEAAMRGAQE